MYEIDILRERTDRHRCPCYNEIEKSKEEVPGVKTVGREHFRLALRPVTFSESCFTYQEGFVPSWYEKKRNKDLKGWITKTLFAFMMTIK